MTSDPFNPETEPKPTSTTNESSVKPYDVDASVEHSREDTSKPAQIPRSNTGLSIEIPEETSTGPEPTGVPPSAIPPSVPPPTPAVRHAPSPQTATDQPDDPRVTPLKSMFPDFDSAVLASVLDSVNGDQDRAIDMLLSMNDPSYVSQQPAHDTSTDLDEQLARRLYMEEEQAHQQVQQPAWTPSGNVPYQPRPQSATRPHPGAAGNPGGSNSMADVQDQISRMAETGKKTFGAFVSKVKAKLQEFDNPSQRPNQESQWAGQNPSYYVPPEQNTTSHPPITQSPIPPHNAVQGFNTAGPGSSITPDRSTGVTPVGVADQPPLPPRNTSGTASPPPQSTMAVPSGATPLDPASVGMPPKRVSVLGAPNSQIQRPEDDDELEYTENPFEEHRK